MRSKVLLFILTALAITTGTSVAMASQLADGTTNPIADADIAFASTTPDVASAEAAVAEQISNYVTELEKQQKAVEARRVQSPKSNFDPGDGSRWDLLAQCEAGGDWARNSGNGFGGGLQFMHQSSYSTWLSFGGGEFAAHPWEATREQQIVVAERVLARSGWNAWPGCSRKFGWL